MSATGCFGSLCMRNLKHVKLIKSCYPRREGEKGPRSSELSYLTFYASSRPAKLTKVGRYLQYKVERDIYKGRKQNNQVSLSIIKALIQSCHHDLNLFSKWVVRILNKTLDTRNSDLVELSCETFVIFCNYHDGSTLGIDPGFTSDFEALLQKFASFCNYANEDEDYALRMQYIGHRGLQAAVTSSALHASDFSTQLDIILPALLQTLIVFGEAGSRLEKTETVATKEGEDGLTKGAIEALAAQSTGILFSKSNGAAVRMALGLVYTFANDNGQWWPPDRVVSTMELILDSVQQQYRYLLVSETLQQLEISNNLERSYFNDKHSCLISVLDTVLNADNAPLVGVSVLEVLNVLFTLLVKSLHVTSFRQQLPADQNDRQAVFEYVIHQGIIHSIGGLASQNYYQNQLDDMAGYIIAKLRASTTLDHVDGLPIQVYRHVALICLDQLVGAEHTSPVVVDTPSGRSISSSVLPTPPENIISAGSWTSAVSLLTDKQPETRLDFARSLIRYLQITAPSPEAISGSHPTHLLTQHTDIVFINSLHHTIISGVQKQDFQASDAQALYLILCSLTRRFTVDAAVRTIPLVFKLQDMVKDGSIKNVTIQRAVIASIVEWLAMVAEYFHIKSLGEYISSIRQQLQDANAWTSTNFSDQLTSANEASFSTNDTHNNTPVPVFVDRHVIVEQLTNESQLRDKHDTHGLELESKLYVEWGSQAFANRGQSLRIRASQDISDHKPKLANPWTTPEPKCIPGIKKETINVENLKEALVAPPQQQQQSGSSSNGSVATSVPTDAGAGADASRRSSLRKNDVNAFLHELQLEQNMHSTHSLVNPPYNDWK
ncbi:hypothetical protein LRAMOSA06331 [Lichtheimia ramosa]|uniref:Protein EFR3 n=1 Tax=Lichtheimia ramosa TaxID=688394 RepID=A0A077X2V2_9FUNG|nr:hypothetical protein LRAMOSA06331 [Lichtheimia ramosa]